MYHIQINAVTDDGNAYIRFWWRVTPIMVGDYRSRIIKTMTVEAFADGNFNNNGADYAEFFESSTGAAIAVGTTVNVVRELSKFVQQHLRLIIHLLGCQPLTILFTHSLIGTTAWNKFTEAKLIL